MHERLTSICGLLESGDRLDVLNEQAVELLGDIADGRLSFPAVRHPLGFIYAPLLRTGSTALRLHIWLAGASRPHLTTSPIHDHTWQLVSYVMCGRLENCMVEIHDSDTPTHQVFEIRGTAGADSLRPTERLVEFRVAEVQPVQAGDRYTIEPGRFHFTEVPEDCTAATMVLAARKASVPERSLGPLRLPEHRMTREECPPAELAAAATTVVRGLLDESVR
jgi:hypothetical protein